MIENTPSAVPIGNIKHSRPAITRQNVWRFRWEIERPAKKVPVRQEPDDREAIAGDDDIMDDELDDLDDEDFEDEADEEE